jgi:hypothetical protein
LYIESKLNFKNSFGASMTLLVTGVCLFVIIILSQDFFQQNQYSIIVSLIETKDSIKEFSMNFMVAYPKTIFEKTRLLERDFDKTDYFKLGNFTQCSDDEYHHFQTGKRNDTLIYLCRDFSKSISLSYQFDLVDCVQVRTLAPDISCNEDFGNELYYIESWYSLDYLNISSIESYGNILDARQRKKVHNINQKKGDYMHITAFYN